MKQLDPRQGPDTHRLSASCVGEDLLVHEFSNVFTFDDGGSERCYMLAIIPYVGDKLVGERVYSDRHTERRRTPEQHEAFEAVPGVTVL